IGFSEPAFPPVCSCRTPSDRPSPKVASGSAGLHFSRSPVSPNQRPSSPGTGDSLPANLTAPNYVLHQGGTASHPNWKRSLCASPEGQHPSPIRDPASTQAEPEYYLEGFHRLTHGGPCLHR